MPRRGTYRKFFPTMARIVGGAHRAILSTTNRMKYVLRNKSTGQYLKGCGVWVAHIEEAVTFDDASEAREFSQAYRIENAQPVRFLMPSLTTLLAVPPPVVTGA